MFTALLFSLIACATDGDSASDAIVGDAAAGESIFADNCAGCHGADGSGGTGPDLTGESDVAEMTSYVTDGEGGMPAFGETLTEQEIADVVAYTITL